MANLDTDQWYSTIQIASVFGNLPFVARSGIGPSLLLSNGCSWSPNTQLDPLVAEL